MNLSFRNRDDAVLSGVYIASVLVIAGCLGYLVAAPKPNPKAVQVTLGKKAISLHADVKAKTDQLAQETDEMTKRLWDMKTEEIGPAALNQIGALAKNRHVKMVAFRPQRIVNGDLLEQVPFQMSVDGNYANVIAFAHDIETANINLAVNLVQMSAGDGNTDAVSATIGIVAFRQPEGATGG